MWVSKNESLPHPLAHNNKPMSLSFVDESMSSRKETDGTLLKLTKIGCPLGVLQLSFAVENFSEAFNLGRVVQRERGVSNYTCSVSGSSLPTFIGYGTCLVRFGPLTGLTNVFKSPCIMPRQPKSLSLVILHFGT